jgi:hypothetical protein
MVLDCGYRPHEGRYVERGARLGILNTTGFLDFEWTIAHNFINGTGVMVGGLRVREILWGRIHMLETISRRTVQQKRG